MADFSEVVNNRVARSISVDDSVCINANGVFDKAIGIEFCQNLMGGTWVLASDYVPLPITQDEAQAIVSDFLNAGAKQKDYDSIISACTYALSSTPKYKAEGEACVLWRDQVWAKAYLILGDVQSGVRPPPTSAQLLSELPPIAWPNDGTANGTSS